MSKSYSWLEMNIEEIIKRTRKCANVTSGCVIMVNGGTFKRIDLVRCNDSKREIVAKSLISYHKLKRAVSVEDRICIILDAVRDFDFVFYFDEEVTNLILDS